MTLSHHAIWPCLHPFLSSVDQVHVWHTNRSFLRILAPFVIKHLRIFVDVSYLNPTRVHCSDVWHQHISKATVCLKSYFLSYEGEFLHKWISTQILLPLPDLFSRLRDLHVPCVFSLTSQWISSLKSIQKLTIGCSNSGVLCNYGAHVQNVRINFDLPSSLQELHLVGDAAFMPSMFANWPESQRMCSKLSVVQSKNTTWKWLHNTSVPVVPEGVSHLSFQGWFGFVGSRVRNFWPQSLRELHLIDCLGCHTNIIERNIVSTSACGLRNTCLEVFTLETRAFSVDVGNPSLPPSLQSLTIHAEDQTAFQSGCLPLSLTYLDIGNSISLFNGMEQTLANLKTLIIGRRMIKYWGFMQLYQLHTLILEDDGKNECHYIAYTGEKPSSLRNIDPRIVLSRWDISSEVPCALPPNAKRHKTSGCDLKH